MKIHVLHLANALIEVIRYRGYQIFDNENLGT